MIPKVKPFRSVKYLDHIRGMDCLECEWPADLANIEAHHIRTGGMATKCGDDETVPLCGYYARGCHNEADKSPDSFEKYQEIARSLFQSWSVKNGKKKSKTV